jgi:hypothetical protein
MKWFSLLVTTLGLIVFFLPSMAFTEADKPIVIQSIVHSKVSEGKETITFSLAASVVPKIFTLRGDNPRLVIDFPGSIYRGKNIIPLGDSLLASAIRIGLHPTPVQRTRAVVDLSKDAPVHYVSEYSKESNTLLVTLTWESAQQQSTLPTDQAKSNNAPQDREKGSTSLPATRPPSPVSSINKGTTPSVSESPAASVVPKILDISFDDSSEKGEMVLFRLSDFYPPTVTAIGKDKPQVLCQFNAMDFGPEVQKAIFANGKYIERIRATRQQNKKVQVVVDLIRDRDYDLQQVFFKNDNLFMLIVNELPPTPSAE